MKKRTRHIAFLLLVILAAAAVFGGIRASSSTLAPADKVEMKQIYSIGDPSAADGLKMTTRIFIYSEIGWSIAGRFSEGSAEFKTTHKYSQWGSGFYQESSRMSISADIMQVPELRKLVTDIVESPERTELQTEVSIKLSDYMEYLPVSAEFSGQYGGYYSSSVTRDMTNRMDPENEMNKYYDELNKELNELVKIPVTDDMSATIVIYTRDQSLSPYPGYFDVVVASGILVDPYSFLCRGTLSGGKYYINEFESDDVAAAFRDGPGIYSVPAFAPDESMYYAPDGWCPRVSEAKKCLAFEDGWTPVRSGILNASEDMVVFAGYGDRLRAYIVFPSKDDVVQVLEIGKYSRKYEDLIMYYDDEFIGLHAKDTAFYILAREKDGRYSVHTFPEDHSVYGPDSISTSYLCVEWDGARLAAAGFLFKTDTKAVNGTGVFEGVRLAVYEESGLKYYTEYSTSLKDIPSLDTGWSYNYAQAYEQNSRINMDNYYGSYVGLSW